MQTCYYGLVSGSGAAKIVVHCMEKVDPIEALAEAIGSLWPHVAEARVKAQERYRKLMTGLEQFGSNDVSMVVFGSLARGEWTRKSDIDWTLLVDGQADPFHLESARKIQQGLEQLGEKKPGPTGVFGNLAFSHELIHQIGGEEDTNSNTTRRILLLLEGMPLGRSDAYRRVVAGVLTRYFQEDQGFRRRNSDAKRIPHFLLNDVARYWRTMAVDFAHKQRMRENSGFAIRNIKLRFSRKLLYIAGLLACFSFELELDSKERDDLFNSNSVQPLIEFFEQRLNRTPLQWVAGAVLPFPELYAPAKKFFDAYDQFLALLDDEGRRNELEQQGADDALEASAFSYARQQSHEFRDAIREIFLQRGNPIGELTIDYGVF